MIGTAIFFLERIIDENITIIMWATLLTIAPIALGVTSGFESSKPIHRMFKAIGLIILGFGIAIWIAIARGYENIDMFTPLKTTQSVANIGGNNQVAKVEFKKVHTLSELQTEVQNSSKPVMLDFYADWCIYCLTYEKQVFTDSRVANILQNFTLLKVDVTHNTDDDSEILSHFKIVAPPAILFFDGGKELRSKRVVGEKDSDEFYQILQNIN